MGPDSTAIVISPDKGYRLPSLVMIYSLLKNHPHRRFKIYILLDEVDPDWIQVHKELIYQMGSTVELIRVESSLFSEFRSKYPYPPSAYYRVFAADLIPEERVLYLDSDLLIHGSIEELIELDMGAYPIAAVEDSLVDDQSHLSLKSTEGYFNSGVLLMDLNEFRDQKLGSRVAEYLKSNPEKIYFADQCGFNAVLKGNWMPLNPKWNFQSGFLNKDLKRGLTYSEREVVEAKKEPHIIHFTGASKPWKTDGKHSFRPLYWKYLQETPLARKYPEDLSFVNLVKRLAPVKLRKLYWRYKAI
ncbi:glycosyltransferase family 8 protein [uncultured Algoriphagus sp.]|uniref:glycosyltransferase family 8 protein n=1 Tax=uncultured Algoriphagus sp. TaxID=417365 RepID=UPI002591A132|nr:glycosyltransferase family 8 protein [uncultured Algoriphagus sp.]